MGGKTQAMRAREAEPEKVAGPRWYAVQCHANQERQARQNLINAGFQVYLPMRLCPHPKARHPITPFFPRYLFVRFDPTITQWLEIISTVGVHDIIRKVTAEGRVPREVPDRMIDRIRTWEIDGVIHLLAAPEEERPDVQARRQGDDHRRSVRWLRRPGAPGARQRSGDGDAGPCGAWRIGSQTIPQERGPEGSRSADAILGIVRRPPKSSTNSSRGVRQGAVAAMQPPFRARGRLQEMQPPFRVRASSAAFVGFGPRPCPSWAFPPYRPGRRRARIASPVALSEMRVKSASRGLGQMGSRLAVLDTRSMRPPPKAADPLYHTGNYKTWRVEVIARAGGRCEAVTNGQRCGRKERRMFADHVDEVRDGGDRFDLANGQCLCGSHHTAKTAQARAARR
jgi:5-methylcytosine-specific restriction protein A